MVGLGHHARQPEAQPLRYALRTCFGIAGRIVDELEIELRWEEANIVPFKRGAQNTGP